MRVRTADRREAILEAAIQIFRELGYERASMAAISARVGGSKATLYGYFKSKEELFAAAMVAEMEDQGKEAIALLDPEDDDLSTVLCKFGAAYLALLTSEPALSMARTAIAEGTNSTLGAQLYALGPERAWRDMAAYLSRLQEKGLIRPADPLVLAAHLKGLLETGVVEPQLFGATAWFTTTETVNHAVEAFLAVYRVP